MPARPNEKRREELLDALEALILAEGFAHVRIGTLAERLHCSRSTLYKLAPSKSELLVTVYQRWYDRVISDSIAQAELEMTCADKIVRLGKVAGRWQAQGSPAFWRDVRDTPEMADVLNAARAVGFKTVQRFLDEGIATGTVRPINTAYVGYLVWMGATVSRDPDLMAEFGLTTDEALTQLGEVVAHGAACPVSD